MGGNWSGDVEAGEGVVDLSGGGTALPSDFHRPNLPTSPNEFLKINKRKRNFLRKQFPYNFLRSSQKVIFIMPMRYKQNLWPVFP